MLTPTHQAKTNSHAGKRASLSVLVVRSRKRWLLLPINGTTVRTAAFRIDIFVVRGSIITNDDQPSLQHLAQMSPSSAILRVPRDFLHTSAHPFCDVATVWCIPIGSSTPSFPMHFHCITPHTLPVCTCRSDCVAKEGELAAHYTSE